MSRKEKTGGRKPPRRNIKKAADALAAAVETFGYDVGEHAATDAIKVIKRRVDFHKIRDCVRIKKGGSA